MTKMMSRKKVRELLKELIKRIRLPVNTAPEYLSYSDFSFLEQESKKLSGSMHVRYQEYLKFHY